MIEIKPDANNRQKQITPETGIILTAHENGQNTGSAEMQIENGNYYLIALDYHDDPTGELLLRACASYAERRGFKIISARLPQTPLMTKVGFTDGELDVSKVVHYG